MVLTLFNSYIPARRIAFFLLEGFSLALLIWALMPQSLESPSGLIVRTIALCLLIQAMFFYFEMYEADIFKDPVVMGKRIALALACSFVLLVVFSGRDTGPPLIEMVTVLGAAGVAGAFWRIVYSNWAGTAAGQKMLILGAGDLAKNIAVEVIGRHDSGFHVLGFLSEEPGRTGERLVNPCILGNYSNLAGIVEGMRIDRVVVAVEDGRGHLPTAPLLECKMKGIAVDDGFDFFERLTGKLSLESLRPSALIFAEGFRKPRWMEHARRGLSFVLAVIGLVFLLPFALLTALAVKLDSAGPVLYRQERVGEGGGRFTLLKFRSMRVDAEQGVPAWASSDDPRVTRVGRFIRKFRFDEIPQLWNVLRGEMDLVGPRPERQYFVDMLKREIPYYGQRFAVRPGITGWAQICYPYGASKEEALEKLKYDLFYIKHRSIMFDLYIIFQTVKIVLFRKGAR